MDLDHRFCQVILGVYLVQPCALCWGCWDTKVGIILTQQKHIVKAMAPIMKPWPKLTC